MCGSNSMKGGTPRTPKFGNIRNGLRGLYACQQSLALLQDLVLVPLFRWEVRTSRIPSEDIEGWLLRHCQLLLHCQRKRGDRGYYMGE